MKTCNTCGGQVEEQANFCVTCGSSDFSVTEINSQPIEQQVQSFPEGYQHITQEQFYEKLAQPDVGNGNVLAGVVGAFLFSLIGGFLYFVIYQLGIIAGISGLVIFVLANFGYGLFAGTGKKATLGGLISAILAMLVMIFAAEYFCMSYEIFLAFKEMGNQLTIFEAIQLTPEFLKESEVSSAFAGDLAFAYIFGFIASISNIVNIAKARKNK